LGIAFLSLVLAAGAHAQCAVPLLKFGPIDPVHGFPQYYQDSSLLGLQPCLDRVCDPALAIPNPAAPISFPGNFPVETFYHRAISKMTGPAGQTGLLVLALEGSFANGQVAKAGDQIVFTRVRVRATGLTAGGTYTITHPYGVETLQASALGVINFTRDTGLVPLQFQLALTGDVGPFLHFATGATPPPAGSIGNPAADQTITGSPCGQNIFRMQGPGLGAGIETNIFSTLIGKIAPLCGNGVLDFGEQCDLGASNGAASTCCTASCTFAAAGTACNDGNVCNVNGTCDGASSACPVTGFTMAPCTDGNACTQTDTCNGAGGCVGFNPVVCTALDQCHVPGTCNPATGGCSNPQKPNGIACSDGNACTVGDTCSAGACVGGAGLNCNDGNACTVDGCSPLSGCTHAPVNCDDGNPCTADSCNAATGCAHTPTNIGGVCDDGNPLTKLSTCTAAGQCVGVRLLAPLTRTAGEDPSVSATVRSAGDGQWNGTTVRVRLTNMDPRRFPAGVGCRADVTAGPFSGAGTISNGVVGAVAVTNLDFVRTGSVRAGDSASVRIQCTVAGALHRTEWQGTFALP